MDVLGILAVARRWSAVLILGAVLAGAAGYVVASAGPTVYESRVRMLVGPVNTELDALRASDLLTRTYAELVTSDALLSATIEELGLDMSPAELRENVRATADGPTRLLIVRVHDLDPDRSAMIAGSIAAHLDEFVTSGAVATPRVQGDQVESLAEAQRDGVLIVDPAGRGEPVASRAAIITALSALAGLLFVFGIAAAVAAFRETVGGEEEVAAIAGVDTLGEVRGVGARSYGSIAVRARPEGPRATDCQLLATKVELLWREGSLRSLLILAASDGADPGDLAANVASALAERGTHVALVDADHINRGVTRLFSLEGRTGLTDMPWTAEELPLSSMTIIGSRLMVMPAGRSRWAASTNSASPEALVSSLSEMTDLVIITAAAVQEAPDALAWARAADAVAVVVRRNRTKREVLRGAVTSLRQIGANLTGVVIHDPSGPSWLDGRRPLLEARRRRASSGTWGARVSEGRDGREDASVGAPR